MRWAIVTKDGPVEHHQGAPLVIDDVQYTLDILHLAESNQAEWSFEVLAKLGVYPIQVPTLETGKQAATQHLVFDAGVVTEVVDTVEDIPPPPPPEAVTNFQGRMALRQEGLFDAVQKVIAEISDDVERQTAQEALDRGEFSRTSPLLNRVMKILGKTTEDRDELFRKAANISV